MFLQVLSHFFNQERVNKGLQASCNPNLLQLLTLIFNRCSFNCYQTLKTITIYAQTNLPKTKKKFQFHDDDEVSVVFKERQDEI